jgi:integrase
MGRSAQPWYRSSHGSWYCTHAGRQVVLAKGPEAETRAEARDAFYRLKAGVAPTAAVPPAGPTVGDLIDLWLDDCERRVEATGQVRGGLERKTYRWYVDQSREFRERHGALPADALRPLHVTQWVAAHPEWSPGTQRAKVTVVKLFARWAWREGYYDQDPLARLPRPGTTYRTHVLSRDQVDAIFAAIADRPFRDVLFALWASGARPGEVYGVTAAMLDRDAACWRVPHKTRRKTGRPLRVVPLSPELLARCVELAAAYPEGPLFRNTKGGPWTNNAVRCRFRRLRARFDRAADARRARGEPEGLRLKGEATAYSYRHRFGTDAVRAGLQTKLIAEVMGHADGRELERRYADHLAEDVAALETVTRAVRPGAPAAGRGDSSAAASTAAAGPAAAMAAPPSGGPGPRRRGRRRGPTP